MSKPLKSIVELKQRQRLLQIMVFSLVTIMVWVGFSLFRSQNKSAIDPKLQQMAIPLTPTINEEVITELQQKKSYTAQELSSFPIYKIIVSRQNGREERVTLDVPSNSLDATPVPTATPAPSPSPEPDLESEPSSPAATTPL